jgi:hypothetical protein
MNRASQSRVRSRSLAIEQLESRDVPSITFHGGAVLPHVEAEGVYYGSYWTAGTGAQQGSDLNTYLQYLTNSSYMDMLGEYGVGRGTLVDNGIADPSIAAGQTVDDSSIQQMIVTNIDRGFLRAPDANRLYVVYTAPNITVTAGNENSLNDFYGYHDSFTDSHSRLIRYAVIAHPLGNGDAAGLNDSQTLTWVTSHEVAESATNPDNGGWYDTKTGDEIADLCNSVNDAGILNGYVISGVWSNRQNACIIPADAQFLVPSMDVVPPFQLRNQVASAFFGNDEYRSDLVVGDYQELLGRTPSTPEINGWVLALRSGTEDQVLAGFAASDEYYRRSGGNDRAWIDALYHDLLGRTPATAEENAWLAAIGSGASRSSVAYGFAHSAEHETRVIVMDYQAYLGRTPNGSEISGWLTASQHGATNEQIAAIFVSSDEFYLGSGGTVESWLTGLYQSVLGRPADKDGYAAWNAFVESQI